MTAATRFWLLAAAGACNAVAFAVSIWWGVNVFIAPFVAMFGAGALLVVWEIARGSRFVLLSALALTVAGECEPIGGVTASMLSHERPGFGPELVAIAAALAIAGLAMVLLSDWTARKRVDTKPKN